MSLIALSRRAGAAAAAALLAVALAACSGKDDDAAGTPADSAAVPTVGAAPGDQAAPDSGAPSADSVVPVAAGVPGGPGTPPRTVPRRPPRPVGAGDARIITTDGNIELVLSGDTVAMRLSDKVIEKVRGELTRDTVPAGIARGVQDFVRGAVASAVTHEILYAVNEIDDVRYAGGELKFDYRTRHALTFESMTSDNDRKAVRSFAPADAERFVAAFRAKKGK